MRKIALVTGGAKGIGAAIVKELANAGYDVVINYLTSKEKAESLANELIAKGAKVLTMPNDIVNIRLLAPIKIDLTNGYIYE